MHLKREIVGKTEYNDRTIINENIGWKNIRLQLSIKLHDPLCVCRERKLFVAKFYRCHVRNKCRNRYVSRPPITGMLGSRDIGRFACKVVQRITYWLRGAECLRVNFQLRHAMLHLRRVSSIEFAARILIPRINCTLKFVKKFFINIRRKICSIGILQTS